MFARKINFKRANKKISSSAFRNCSKLKKLIILSNTLCTLENVNAFNATPFESATGYIYVPDNLVNTYKLATNWNTFADQIKGISELI